MIRPYRVPWRTLGSLALCAAVLAAPRWARAHQVWHEQDARGAKLYFGELGDNLHDASPGYLDKLTQVSAQLVSAKGERTIAAEKERDGIRIAGRAATGESLVAEDRAYPMLESTEGSRRPRRQRLPPNTP